MIAPGKYDDLAASVQSVVDAKTVLLIVTGGTRGNGISVKVADPTLLARLPQILRVVADLMDGTGEPVREADAMRQIFRAAKG